MRIRLASVVMLGMLCSAVAAHAQPFAAAAQPDSIAARIQPCTACHGARGFAGSDGYYPRIAGKPAGYLFNQMLNFQAGRRHFPLMIYLLQLQDRPYLKEMADYFASQRIPYPPPAPSHADAAQLARGRKIAMQGDAARQVPACVACHGSHLLGTEPAVPGLLGVSEDYLVGQLGAWRSGARTAFAPDCMAEIARRLGNDQIQALAAWLASQSVPQGTEPDGGFPHAPPLRCGSISPAAPGSARTSTTLPPLSTPTLERGRALVTLGDCEACHTARGGAAFAGGRAIPTAFGTFYSPNITPDEATGLGRWSADDFWRALHEGIDREGHVLYPAFPYPSYTRILRSDSDAMFAYLRTLHPVQRPNQRHQLRFPYGHRSLLIAWRLLYFRAGVYQPDAHHTPQWNRGAYLVQGVAHCSACHEARNSLGALRDAQPNAGGELLGWYAPSLTAPDQAALSAWSIPDIVTLLGTGSIGSHATQGPYAVTLGPMAEVVHSSLQYASPQDLQAMATYLQSLSAPPAHAPVAAIRAPDQIVYDGRALYQGHCATCHGDQGQGNLPLGPPLAHNRAVTGTSVTDAIRVVLFGGFAPGTRGDPRPVGMPPYAQSLDDAQIAALLTYVRGAWGNAADPVDVGQVTNNRGNPLW
ncbi:MAG TPA: c-type cytochrome [Steroidobacteraceae bacterium]|nr:c-type cytochrome [Steroidobacteraceae bacterium]